MSIQLYKNSELTDIVSGEGSMTNPDTDIYNGTTGDSQSKELFLANAHSKLDDGIDASTTTITLADDAEEVGLVTGLIIIIDDEQMLVEAHDGAELTVQRGYSGTTPDDHDDEADVFSAYNYTSLVVSPVDVSGSDESSWVRLALTSGGLDEATPGAALSLPNKQYFETVSFFRRITVPPETGVQNKTDLRLRIAAVENPVVS